MGRKAFKDFLPLPSKGVGSVQLLQQ